MSQNDPLHVLQPAEEVKVLRPPLEHSLQTFLCVASKMYNMIYVFVMSTRKLQIYSLFVSFGVVPLLPCKTNVWLILCLQLIVDRIRTCLNGVPSMGNFRPEQEESKTQEHDEQMTTNK
jgi:hypothetical protein